MGNDMGWLVSLLNRLEPMEITATLLNGRRQTNITVSDRGLQYGDGLFETIMVFNGGCPWFDAHYKRLASGCERLSISLPERSLLVEEIKQIAPQCGKAVVKLIITGGNGGRGYVRSPDSLPTRIVMSYPWPEYPIRYWESGVNLYNCNTRLACNPMLAGIKHLCRIEQVIASNEFACKDYAEGVMRDIHGRVIEGTKSNLFMVHDDVLHTPAIQTCGVIGTMRRRIIGLAGSLGIKTKIGNYEQHDLEVASEVLLSNSLIGLWPVRRYIASSFKPGPVYRALLDALVRDYPVFD
jgi:4-amino-4-deoxychorismate lyase